MNRLALSPDGSILAGGIAGQDGTTPQFAVARISADSGPTGALEPRVLTTAGPSSFVFNLTWSAAAGVDRTSLGSSNLRVTGPNGFAQTAAFRRRG